MKTVNFHRRGFTLVEILISVALSLFLLLGVTELFRHVGDSINETQATLNMTANMNHVAISLRSDLANISADVNKPSKIAAAAGTTNAFPPDNGYFEIIEGMNAPYRIIADNQFTYSGYTHQKGTHIPIEMVAQNPDNGTATPTVDNTVGDIDDIIAFTAQSDVFVPYRGLARGVVSESSKAEIIWFVRGTTLYRRVLLIDETKTFARNANADRFYLNNDVSVHLDPNSSSKVIANSLADLARRENRFAHSPVDSTSGNPNPIPFPYPLYYYSAGNPNAEAWYFLRMPTLEETAGIDSSNKSWPLGYRLPDLGAYTSLKYNGTSMGSYDNAWGGPYWDFWVDPNGWDGQDKATGSLSNYVTNPRSRAGEDAVLTNVISFDVKVWNSTWVPTQGTSSTGSHKLYAPPQFVDLGQDLIGGPFYYWNDTSKQWILDTGTDANKALNVHYNFTPSPPPNDWGLGFCSKGKYGGGEQIVQSVGSGTPPSVTMGTWNGALMPCVYDTWTVQYEDEPFRARQPNGTYNRVGTGRDGAINSGSGAPSIDNILEWECPPPYTDEMKGLQITIRCFDPRSKNIKQIRIVHNFPQ